MLTLPELENFITQVRKDNTIDLIQDAVKVFEKYNLATYLDNYAAVLFDNDLKTDEENVKSIIAQTDLLLNYLLEQQGIFTNEEIPLYQLIELCNAVFDITDYEDKSQLFRLIETYDSPSELLAELVALVSNLKPELVLSFNLTVSENLPHTLKATLSEPVDTEGLVDSQTLAEIKKRYLAFKNMIGKAIYSDNYLSEATSIGLPFSVYLSLYQQDSTKLSEEFIDPIPNLIALDLVGMALLSNDGYNNPLMTIKGQINSLYAEIEKTTKLIISVSNIVQQYSKAM